MDRDDRDMAIRSHGASKPTGLGRTYLQVFEIEATLGMLHDKFCRLVALELEVNYALKRMLVGRWPLHRALFKT